MFRNEVLNTLVGTTGGATTYAGGQIWQRKTVNGNYALTAADYSIDVNNGAATAITLPPAPADGTTYWLKDSSGAAQANVITVSGAQNVEGFASFTIDTNNGWVALQYDATAALWRVLDSNKVQLPAIGTAQQPGVVLRNPTLAAAGAGAQQYSPGLQLAGSQWNGAASVLAGYELQIRPVSGSANPPELVFYSNLNGTKTEQYKFSFQDGFPGIYGASATAFYLGTAGVKYIAIASTGINVGTDIFGANQSFFCGTVGAAWKGVNSYQYASVNQALAWNVAGPAAVNPASGQVATATLSVNVTAWSIAGALAPQQMITMVFVQDAVGGRTLAGAAANIKLNGALVLSAGANKRDTVGFEWDGVNYVERFRSLNN
jgi:hypothetical protein